MKILLLALQRTGSKLVHENINRYLATLGSTATLLRNGEPCTAPWYEPRNNVEAHLSPDGKTVDFVDVVPHKEYAKVFGERIPVIESLQGNCCVKVHYFRGFPPELLEFGMHFDHIIILKRRDTFQQLLSFVLSIYSDKWTVSDSQKKFIETSTNRQIRINEHDWRKIVKQFLSFKNVNNDRATVVYFEDLIKITDPSEYARALGLTPVRGFKLDPNDWVEFGNSKPDVIGNIDRLKDIYDELASSLSV